MVPAVRANRPPAGLAIKPGGRVVRRYVKNEFVQPAALPSGTGGRVHGRSPVAAPTLARIDRDPELAMATLRVDLDNLDEADRLVCGVSEDEKQRRGVGSPAFDPAADVVKRV